MSITTPTPENMTHSFATILSVDQKDPLTPEQITAGKRINEQECYAALIHRALTSKKPAVAAKFEKQLKSASETYKGNHGEINLFKISDRLLRQFVRENSITQQEYRELRDFAFGKAQLDSNRIMISSEKVDGSKTDDTPVRALSTFYKKLETNQVANAAEIAQFKAEEAKISVARWRAKKHTNNKNARTVSLIAPTTEKQSTINNAEEDFLWKPKSDSDGHLVVLVPKKLSEEVTSVVLKNSSGDKTLEVGRFSGIANGGRSHFRFTAEGAAYPKNSILEINLKNDKKTQYIIKEPNNRIEGGG